MGKPHVRRGRRLEGPITRAAETPTSQGCPPPASAGSPVSGDSSLAPESALLACFRVIRWGLGVGCSPGTLAVLEAQDVNMECIGKTYGDEKNCDGEVLSGILSACSVSSRWSSIHKPSMRSGAKPSTSTWPGDQ